MVDGLLQVQGGRPLAGEITVRGAKNFVPKAMVAALLGTTPSVLRNVPLIRDVDVVSGLLSLHGVAIDYDQTEGVLRLDPSRVESAHMADIDAHAGSSRIPILFCGPLLHRLGEAFIPDLGGCRIGDRPIDFHLEILRKYGAVVNKLEGGIHITAPAGLRGTVIDLPYPSVGATEQTLLTAVRADGLTELRGAAVEPEILDLVDILQKMGAIISVDTFRKVGGAFDVRDDGIRFYHPGGDLRSIVVETNVHPGFMTDWQQPLVVALTQADGLSIIHETVYENRFGFTKALRKMGATIQVYRECLGGTECRFGQRNFYHSAVVSGPSPLHGADIVVPDLRGGFSHLIAALAAEGASRVEGINLIDRGYEHFMSKLASLDADVSRLA